MAGARIIRFPRGVANDTRKRWDIEKDELVTALSLAEEYALALRVRLYNFAASQDFETSSYTIRRAETLVQILGPYWCVSVDTKKTHKVCAIHKACMHSKEGVDTGNFALECRDMRHQPLLSVTCPEGNHTPEGRLWGGILRSLAS